MRDTNNSSRVVTLLSGGIDSSTLLYLLNKDFNPIPIFINYGQRHIWEAEAAKNIAASTSRNLKIFDLSFLGADLKSCLTQSGAPVPEGHYEEPSMKATVVPNRNMIMLSIAAGYAISEGVNRVAYAAHAGDHAIYPDCRPEFMNAMQNALQLCHYEPIRLMTPFRIVRKDHIVKLGADLGVPFKGTYSCYNGRPMHCGKCGTCTERKEAFKLAGVDDPTTYEEV